MHDRAAIRLFHFLLLLAVAAPMLIACRRSIDRSPQWDTELLVPLLYADLSVSDLIPDSLVQVEDDHSLSLVFTSSLYRAGLDELALEIPDTAISRTVSLQTLALADRSLVYPYSLGALCQQLGPLGLLLIGYNGQFFNVPPLANLSTPDNPVDATALFESAQIESGFLDLTLENGFPLEWSQIVFEIRNQSNQQIVTRDTFLNLLPGTQQTKSINLAGKLVEGKLIARITDMDSPGGYVLIDTSDAILITLVARELKVSEATAVFPAQNLIDQQQLTTYSLSGGAELNQLHIQSGRLGLRVVSSIAQDCYFEYALPSAKDALGNSIFISKKLDAAPPAGTTEFYQSFDLAGYTFDLSGPQGNLFNTFYSNLVLRVDSTGQLVTLSKTDSIRLVYELVDLKAGYLSGYLGQQILSVGPQETSFSLFPSIRSGTLKLTGAELSLELENGVGVGARLNLYELLASNASKGTSLSLSWTQLGKPLSLAAATDHPFQAGISSFILNDENSNISELISLLPDRLRYRLDVFLNPFGNSSGYQDFAYSNSYLEARLSAAIPLSLSASDLLLMDTLDFSLTAAESQQTGTIRDGLFQFHVSNGFPLHAGIQVFFHNADFSVLDSLFASPQQITAAAVDADCRVQQAASSVLTAVIGEEKMERLRVARKAVIRVVLNTGSSPICPVVRLYDTYRMNLRLTGRFTLQVGS
ncbi:MAG: hypothetical protein RMK52_00520 [Chitinophagales bacterium]|nr:hypothetical protein [Chitinophagales bacterium]MDW8392709.1 hypothetical protein [Chitinophagales bacterium]